MAEPAIQVAELYFANMIESHFDYWIKPGLTSLKSARLPRVLGNPVSIPHRWLGFCHAASDYSYV